MSLQTATSPSPSGLSTLTAKALALLSIFALGGCWASEGPLMPAAQIDPPPISGKYRSTKIVGVGKGGTGPMGGIYEHKILNASGSGLAVETYRDDDRVPKPHGTLLFDRLTSDVYLVQKTDKDGVFYGLLRIISKSEVATYELACNAAVAGEYGVTRDNNLCIFQDYDTVRRLATRLIPVVMDDTSRPRSLDEVFDPQQAFYDVSGYVRE